MKQALSRRVQAKGMVRPFGVIDEELVSASSVEVRHVVEEHVLVVIHELFLEGASQAFRVGVHVRGMGIGQQEHQTPLKVPWQGPRGIDNTVWDTRASSTRRTSTPERPWRRGAESGGDIKPMKTAIAAAGLIESFLWDIPWDRPNNRVPEARV